MKAGDIKDEELLRRAALLLDAENRRLIKENLELKKKLSGDPVQLRLAELEQQLSKRNQMLFGKSSEKRSCRKAEGAREKQRGHGPTEQPQLSVLEQTHELDEADKTCPSCGGNLEVWEGQAEESEEVDVLERRFVLVKHRRQKYRCSCGGCVEVADGPKRLIKGGRYSVDFAVQVAVDKYADHLPLERQVRIAKRQGLVVTSQTLWGPD